MMKMSDPLPSNRLGPSHQQPFHTPIRLPVQTLLRPSPDPSVNDVFTGSADIYNTPNSRCATGRPEALHEIGLTLKEVDEVLRRRASLTSRLDPGSDFGSPSPHQRISHKPNHRCPGEQEIASSMALGTCFRPIEPTAEISSPTPPAVFLLSKTQRRSKKPSKGGFATHEHHHHYHNHCHHHQHHHQRARTFPINISPTQTISSKNSTLHDRYATAPSFINTSPTLTASSLSRPESFDELDPLDRMTSTIRELEHRIADLERKYRDLEGEVDHWKAEADRAKPDHGAWYMF